MLVLKHQILKFSKSLSSPVVHQVGGAGEAGNGADGHYLPGPPLDHLRQQLLVEPEVRKDVHVEGAPNLSAGQLVQRRTADDAGVVCPGGERKCC